MSTNTLSQKSEIKLESLPPQDISTDVLLEKYAKGDEASCADVRRRIARSVASVNATVYGASPAQVAALEARFLESMEKEGLVPAGRISSAAGTGIQATLINCFVQPVGDSLYEFDERTKKPAIYTAVAQAAETMRKGGGVGYDFSAIRPLGAWVGGTNSRASGPISFMKVFDASCETVESAGSRRGAQMGVLRCDHPDIELFIHAKDEKGRLNNFNISIGVTDEFMEAVAADGQFDLVHSAKPHPDLYPEAKKRGDGKWIYKTIRARDLWDQVMASTYDHAEPGILYISRMNKENNLYYCEVIEATNPCAEQPLPNYGCCDLGSVNLTVHVRNPFSPAATFDFESYAKAVRTGIRLLENVLDLTVWPLEEQRAEAMAKRRIGLGFLGLGSALIMLGLKYNSPEGREMARKISEVLRNEAYRESIELAKERGPFPLFDAEKYLAGEFVKRLPNDIRMGIAQFGIRNSHLISIAPTGTITLAFADNASNGIEPPFSWVYTRKKRLADGSSALYEVADHAWRLYRHMGFDVTKLPEQFVTALEMTVQDHMQMMQVVQPYVDTAISKTVNVPEDYPYEDFKKLYMEGWKAGLKGLATYRPNSVLGAVLSVAPPPAAPAPAVSIEPVALPDDNPLRKQFDSRPLGNLESVTSKISLQSFEGNKSVYLTVSFIRVTGVLNGKEVTIERPVEFFVPAGQRDEGQQWIAATMRQLSFVARSGGLIADALASLREVIWDKGQVRCGYIEKDDGAQKPMFHDSEVAAIGYSLQKILHERGFLDAFGNQVPVHILAERLARRTQSGKDVADLVDRAIKEGKGEEVLKKLTDRLHSLEQGVVEHQSSTSTAQDEGDAHQHELSAGPDSRISNGKKCPECGANALHKVDGCTLCASCGYVGSCG